MISGEKEGARPAHRPHQPDGKEGARPAHPDQAPAAARLDPEHVVVMEDVKGSDVPVRLMYVETIDGVYAPIGLRTPSGDGPFPLVLFASGNGGGGMAAV